MHPAFSVIFFTVLSGAGYGLMFWLSCFGLVGELDTLSGIISLLIAWTLISVGLLSSMAHLGQPKRFLLAFTQWRSSWLSREAVSACFSFVPSGLFGLLLLLDNTDNILFTISAVLSIISALMTTHCTAMIYASIRAVPCWNSALTPLCFQFLSITSGAILILIFMHFLPLSSDFIALQQIAIPLLLLTFVLKLLFWLNVEKKPLGTRDDATGLGIFGDIRTFETPHSQDNYLMKEMGYKLARKYRLRLRKLTVFFLFLVPAIITLVGPTASSLSTVTLLLTLCIGLLFERWLFFAEARHVVNLYY